MKIIAISDTHGQHHLLKNLPAGDLLIHAGDVSSRGKEIEIQDFFYWLAKQDYKYKVLIAGNHDFFFEQAPKDQIQDMIPDDVIYLNDSGVEIEGIKIWGSPVQPWFHDWAFNRARGAKIQKHWDLIPSDTDILITHGPPMGILDVTIPANTHVGCQNLMNTILQSPPQVHIFGHIHEAYGIEVHDGVKYINASVLNLNYKLANPPIEFDFVASK
jgi:Icc-related predicted phosphoesterase